MSKESYIRGFCKAAESAGVDPVALAKYAQATNDIQKVEAPKYKTDGWAPLINQTPGSSNIPHSTAFGEGYTGTIMPNSQNIYAGADLDMGKVNNDRAENLMRILDPRRAAWNAARIEAGKKLINVLDRAGYNNIKKLQEGNIQPEAMRLLEKMYHDEMRRLTSAPPVQVSAPATGLKR